MTASKIGWAIISTGQHPDNKIAPAIAAAQGSDLVAVFSRDQSRADDFAQRHGAQAAYSDLDDLLGDSRVDAVFIASPNALHAVQSIEAAKAGKHVLSEKPMATTIDDSVAMVQACQRARVKLGVGFNLRQHPGHIKAKELIALDVLGGKSQRAVEEGQIALRHWIVLLRPGRDGATENENREQSPGQRSTVGWKPGDFSKLDARSHCRLCSSK